MVYLIYKLIKNYKNNFYYHCIVLFLIFTIFNFASISHYLLIILLLSIIWNYNLNINNKKIFIIIFSIIFFTFSILFSSKYFLEENKLNKNKNYITNNILLLKIKYSYSIKNLNNLSVTKYFDLWNDLWEQNQKKQAIFYYKKWLSKLPNMWDINSKYYNNIIIKNLFIKKRFYSEKFSDLKQILEKVKINIK